MAHALVLQMKCSNNPSMLQEVNYGRRRRPYKRQKTYDLLTRLLDRAINMQSQEGHRGMDINVGVQQGNATQPQPGVQIMKAALATAPNGAQLVFDMVWHPDLAGNPQASINFAKGQESGHLTKHQLKKERQPART